jgi:HEAT repeat protein
MVFEEDLRELKRAPWPKCIELAERLARLGPGAAPTLAAAATTARSHHVRSASLRSLAKVDRQAALKVAKKLLTDRSYEVREDAKEIVKVLSG